MEKRIKTIPQHKKDTVKKIAEKMKSSKTILIASTKGLPASQFQAIKRKLRGKAEISMARKTLIIRAIADSGKGTLQNLKTSITRILLKTCRSINSKCLLCMP